ncbi:MAG: alkaline phosphatase family protein [Candidatus Moduliflexus flocculans]|nr:alkaline phosphatase family protein [Candidatus Moduliflexus flocculans]
MIAELARRGVMSTMARLMDIGKLHRMKASLPEISAVSWTDFMTGTDSGTHGIFGFTDFKPRSYDIRFPNYLDVKAPTLWDKLGRQGPAEHRHQPAVDLPGPQDRGRPHLRLRRPRAGQGGLADDLPGRPASRWATRSTSTSSSAGRARRSSGRS